MCGFGNESVSRRKRLGLLGSLVLLIIALGLALAPRSEAYVYWSNWALGTTDPHTISRANLDGSGQDFDFIAGAPESQPTGLSVNGSHIFWANSSAALTGPKSIGRAPLNSTSPDQEFIELATAPNGTAVDGTHIYWGSPVEFAEGVGLLGRANLDGGSPNESFIAGASTPIEVAVTPTHIYWANSFTDSIGRAPLDNPLPADIDFEFITTGVSSPNGVAVDGTHVYWTNFGNDTIGRAELDGSDVDPDYIGSSGADQPCDIAVHDGKLYWANNGAGFPNPGSIGRADIGATPSNVEEDFISGANVEEPCGIAADNLSDPSCEDFTVNATQGKPLTLDLRCAGGGLTHELTGTPVNGQITDFNAATGRLTYTPNPGFLGQEQITHRASNAGSVDPSAIATATIVVSRAPSPPGAPPPGPPPPAGKASNDFTLGKAKRNKKKGTAKLPVTVPGPGSLDLAGKKVKPRGKDAAAAGRVTLAVKPKRKAKKKLKTRGKAKVRFSVTFSPTGGDPAAKSAKVKLKKKRRR